MNGQQKEQDRRETNLKARMAQSLVRDLLTESGNDVHALGLESLVPVTLTLEDALEKNRRLGEKLRSIPDFLVLDTKGMPHVLEVKFRWRPEGHSNDAKRLKVLSTYWDEAMVVFVNCSEKPYFRVSHAPFVNRAGKIVSVPLESFEAFSISDSLIKKFELLVAKYLTPTLFPKQE